MKRILALLMLVAMLLSFAACGSKKASAGGINFEVPDAGYDGSEVTITFYHTMGQNIRPVLQAYIPEFNKLYPNIHIVEESVGGYDDVRDQISTQISEGNQPNIAYCYADHVALYNLAGAVTTLDPLIDSEIEVTRADGTTEILGFTDAQKADFIQGYYNEGKQFGGGQIKAIDPESIPLGYDSEANWFITMCEQYGSPYTSASGDHFLFDNEQNRAFVKEFNEWYQKGYLTTQTLYGSYTSGLFVAKEGIRSYMSIGSSAGATHQRPAMVDGAYPFEVGITTIPQVDANNKKVISQGPSLCIFQKSNPQEVIASWLFVKFLTTTVEFQAEFAMASGYVPVLKSVGENPVYADFLAHADGGNYIAALSAKVCLEQEDAYYASPAFNGSSTARDEVGALMAKCLPLTGDVDGKIADAFEEAIEECEYFQ